MFSFFEIDKNFEAGALEAFEANRPEYNGRNVNIEITKKAYERWDGASVYFTDPNGYTLEFIYFDASTHEK